MLEDAAYDILEFPFPAQGMSQAISPDHLPSSFAYLLENIIARPLGEGQVRFGTRKAFSLPQPDAAILKAFPFVKADGGEQLLLYVQEFAQDAAARNFVIRHDRQFSFTSPHQAARYVKDAAIKIEYALNGHVTLYDTVAALTVEGTTVTVTLGQNALTAGAAITRVSFPTGTLYSYESMVDAPLSSHTLSPPLKRNLSVACVPRCAAFIGKLLICNGVDRVMSWDGTILEDVYGFVEEETAHLARMDGRRLSFTVPPSVVEEFGGQPGGYPFYRG